MMMRTTVDIERSLLDKLKSLQRKEKMSLGELVSSLLAEALHHREHRAPAGSGQLAWTASDMGARVSLGDKEALYRALDT